MKAGFLVGEVGNGLRRNVSMVVSVVLVTMVSLVFLGLGLLAQRQVDTMQGYWYDRIEVSIFLCTPESTTEASCADGEVSQAQQDQIEQTLESLQPEIIDAYWFESSDEAYERFLEQFRNSPTLDKISPEAIPASFRVSLEDPGSAETVATAFRNNPGVESVEDQREIIDRLFTLLNAVSVSAVALAGAMVLCAVLLISTTIRLTAHSRRRETNIMRLVGASAFTIHLPFIIETVLAALLGALFSIGLLWAMLHYGVAGYLTDFLAGPGGGFMALVGPGDLWTIAPFLVGGAVLLAVITSWLALRRHVRI